MHIFRAISWSYELSNQTWDSLIWRDRFLVQRARHSTSSTQATIAAPPAPTTISSSNVYRNCERGPKFTWSDCHGYDGGDEESSTSHRLRLMKACVGASLVDDDIGTVELLGRGDEPGKFMVKVTQTGKNILRKSSALYSIEGEQDHDDAEEEITHPFVEGVCRWEYKGDVVAECFI
eukprot:3840757-Pleurochrysis_carterae.AAC.4